MPYRGIAPISPSGISFPSGLRFSANILTQLLDAWHSLIHHVHYATLDVTPSNIEPIQKCEVAERLAFKLLKADKALPFASRLIANLVWPRILAEKVPGQKFKPLSSVCHLNFHFGRTEGLSLLRIQNLVTEPVTCRLTLVNPTDKPLFIQPILLDDLLPPSMNYTEMVEQMPILSEELLRAAHAPLHTVKFPRVR